MELTAQSAVHTSPRASIFGRPSGALAAILCAGAAAHLALLLASPGASFDIASMASVYSTMRSSLLHVYAVNAQLPHWPYSWGYLPVIAIAGHVSAVLGLSFARLIRLPPIAADLALAWLVHNALRARGQKQSVCLASAGLVALGPVFLATSAVHGQLDAVAILPAFLAVVVWDRRPDDPRRALWAGALIGLGAAIKTVPAVVVIALLPHCRSRREAVTLIGAAVLVAVVPVLPFALAEPHGALAAVRYHGAPGIGGLSLLVDPHLAVQWLVTGGRSLSAPERALQHASGALLVVGLLGAVAVLWRTKPPPAVGASLAVLVLWVFGVNFFQTYAVWGVPFFLLAGWWKPVAVAQVAFVVPLTIIYASYFVHGIPFGRTVVEAIFVPAMIAAWVASAGALAWIALRMPRRSRAIAGGKLSMGAM